MGKSDLIDERSYVAYGLTNVQAGSAGGAVGAADLSIFDSSIGSSYGDNVVINSPNAKVVRNAISGGGGAGTGVPTTGSNVVFNGSELLLTNNIIQQASGWGVAINTARSVRMADNYLDDNGKQINGTGGVLINNSGHITLCGNTFEESAGATEAATTPTRYPAHITFEGTDDSVALCGNVYLPFHTSASNNTSGDSIPGSILVHPDYDYDAFGGAQLSNISIADNQAPQNIGVLSPTATTRLPGALQGQPVPNFISGLTLSNDSVMTKLDISGGAATDASGTTSISMQGGCTIDLGTIGAGGIDQALASTLNTTFFVFAISGPEGANPSCIASASPKPAFVNTGTRYSETLAAIVTPSFPTLFNVGQSGTQALTSLQANPLGGLQVGDTVLAGSSTLAISSLQSFAEVDTSGTLANGSRFINLGSLTGKPLNQSVLPGMLVAGTGIPVGTTISVVNPGSCTVGYTNCIKLSGTATSSITSGATVSVSGNYTITLNGAVSGSAATSETALPGRYRLVGMLYTDGSGKFVSFHQDGDTYYLQKPAVDIASGGSCSTGIATASCSLSVPCGKANTCGSSGVQVEAFGRIVGGPSKVWVSSPDQANAAPAIFSTSPGYSISNLTPDTAFPFRAHTDAKGQIQVSAISASTTIQEMTDGWVFRR